MSDDQANDVQRLIDSAVEFGPSQVNGLTATISVAVDGRHLQSGPTEPVIAASMAKVWWVLAAVDAVGTDPVAPFVEDVFAASDNVAAGDVIDLIGIDAVNAWTREHGMEDTYVASWSFGDDVRRASDISAVGRWNQTSARDAARAVELLATGELFDPETTQTVLDWMRIAPDTRAYLEDWGAAFADDLPPEIAATAAHKAGWLPPNCCAVETNQVSTVGVVPLTDGTPLIIAVTAAGGLPYTDQVDWVSGVVADIHAELSQPRSVDVSS